MYKLYFDGSKKDNYISYGYVLYHEDKILLKHGGKIYNKSYTSNVAEYIALIVALMHINNYSIEEITIYGDNLSIIEQIKKPTKKHKRIGYYQNFVHEYVSRYKKYEFIWIPRKENRLADREAR